MSFDWMQANVSKQPTGPRSQVTEAVKQQASLIRRLGYDAKYATKRCLQNVHWQYDGSAMPLKDNEIKKVVAQVFQ